jgi:hypothetical protein
MAATRAANGSRSSSGTGHRIATWFWQGPPAAGSPPPAVAIEVPMITSSWPV